VTILYYQLLSLAPVTSYWLQVIQAFNKQTYTYTYNMSETTVNMESEMGWEEFFNLYAKINRLSLTPTPLPSLGLAGPLNYLFSPEYIRDVIKAHPVKSCKARHSSPYIRYHDGFGNANSAAISASPVYNLRDTSFTPPSPVGFPPSIYSNSSLGSTSSTPPSSPSHWGSWSRSSSPPSSPTRPFSNRYKHVPEQPANAQGIYVYLPLPAQIKVLSKVQKILENTCFDFAQTFLPHILQQNGWDCPEAGELNVWMHQFAKQCDLRILHRFAQHYEVEEPIHVLMESAKQIRHAAVHRNRLTVTYLAMLMDHAIALSTLLGGSNDVTELHAIRDRTNAKISQIESITEEASKDIIKFIKSR
jgi:hypothetical protein